MNNIDVIITPLQIYTISHFIEYASALFNTYENPDNLKIPEIKPIPIPTNSPPKPSSPTMEKAKKPASPMNNSQKIDANLEIFRITVKILLDDPGLSSKCYFPYKSEDLVIEGQIPGIQLKTPNSFFEILLVNTGSTYKKNNNISEISGHLKYLLVSTNLQQNYAFKHNGQLLEESSSTIYASAHRAFSIPMEAPNILLEENSLNPNRNHFCVQKLLEIRAPPTSSSMAAQYKTVAEQWEKIIDVNTGIPKLNKKIVDEIKYALKFELKMELVDGKIVSDQHLSTFLHDPRKIYSGNSKINMLNIALQTSGICIDFSPESLIYIDHIFNPTHSMLIDKFQQYSQILELYNTEPLYKSKLSGELLEVVEKVTEVLQINEPFKAPPEDNGKNWILQKICVKIPNIKLKVWMLDSRKNLIIDYYRDRNVEICRKALAMAKNENSQKGELRETQFEMTQTCRCMDLCRIADNLSGHSLKASATLYSAPYLYYRDELLVLEIENINLTIREICDSAAISGQLILQGLLTDISIGEVLLYANLEGKMRNLSKIEFSQSPYSIRIVKRDKITPSNRLLVDAEIVNDKVKIEYKPNLKIPENYSSEENTPKIKETEIAVIETSASKKDNNGVVKVSVQIDNEEIKNNPFMKESSEFSDRENHMKLNGRTYVDIKLKSVNFVVNLDSIPQIINFLNTTNDTMFKVQSFLENTGPVFREIEAYIRDFYKKKSLSKPIISVIKKKSAELPLPSIAEDSPKNNENNEQPFDLPLSREESKCYLAKESDSSDSEKEEKKEEIKKSVEVENDNENKANLVINFTVEIISAYLCEYRENMGKKKQKDLAESALQLDEEIKMPEKYKENEILRYKENRNLFPLIIIKFGKLQCLIYKYSEFDTQIKLQIFTPLVLDNTLFPIPLYSINNQVEESKKIPYTQFFNENLINSNEDCDFFMSNHSPSIILYKEEALKNSPSLTLSLKLLDKHVSALPGDAENEIEVHLGINGLIFRPEPHTETFQKILKMIADLKPPPQAPQQAEPIKKPDEPQQINIPQNMFRQLLKLNISIRNLTIDIWPVVHLSYLLEIDPPILPPSTGTDISQCFRSRQRILFMQDRITFKYISAPFLGQEKVSSFLEDTRLSIVNSGDLSQIMLLDTEFLLNSTLSIVNKLGFCDIANLEKLELKFASQSPTKEKPENLVKTEIIISCLALTGCYDALIAVIRAANCILSEIGEIQINKQNNKPEEKLIEKPKEIIKPIIPENKKEANSYEILRQTRREELKLSNDMAKSNAEATFQIVNQKSIKEKGSKSMRFNEKIDQNAMKNAFAMMDENPDYYTSQGKDKKSKEISKENIEGDVIIQKTEEGSATIIKGLEIITDHVEEPKVFKNPHESEFHKIPEGYEKPVFIFGLSISKIAVILFDGDDLENSDKVKLKKGGFTNTKKRKTDTFMEISLGNIGAMLTQYSAYFYIRN